MCAICGDRECSDVADTREVTVDIPLEMVSVLQEWSKQSQLPVRNILNMTLLSGLTKTLEMEKQSVFENLLPVTIEKVYLQ